MAIFSSKISTFRISKASASLFSVISIFLLSTFASSDPLWDADIQNASSGVVNEADAPSTSSVVSEAAVSSGSLQRAPGSQWLNKEPTQARVVAVYGNVMLRNSIPEPEVELTAGMFLDIDDEVVSAANSGAHLIFDDGSTVRLSGKSLLNFKRLYRYGSTSIRDIQIFLQRGQVESNVKPLNKNTSKFEVVTPSAITGVRGTQYRVAVDARGQQTWVTVLEGAVAVASAGKELVVKEGFSTLAQSEQAPTEPREILPSPDLSLVADSHTNTIVIPLSFTAGAQAFRVQLMSAVDGTTYFDETITEALVAIDNLTAGLYQVEVSALDTQGVEGRSATKSITLLKEADQTQHWLYRILFITGVLIVLL